jgi:hypothetical protein
MRALRRKGSEEEGLRTGEAYLRGAILLSLSRGYLSSQMMGEQLHPVAYSQYRHVLIQDVARQLGRIRCIDAGWAPGEDEPPRIQAKDALSWRIPGEKLTVDVRLPYTSGDQLSILGAKI